jgi:hypothetical protein
VKATLPDDFSDMELAILHSAAAPSLVRLRPHFSSGRRQMTENGFDQVPSPMTSSGVRDDLAADLFWLLVKQSRDPKLRRERTNAEDEHNLRNILSHMRLPMFANRGRWK